MHSSAVQCATCAADSNGLDAGIAVGVDAGEILMNAGDPSSLGVFTGVQGFGRVEPGREPNINKY